MKFRHEVKHAISYGQLLQLRQRLSALLYPDPHASDGSYQVRSLYFDTPWDTALREKLDGVSRREKFRLRCYNLDLSLIRLEKKSKLGGLCNKQTAPMTREQVSRLLEGDILWMAQSPEPLVRELYVKMTTGLLQPKTLVDYTREPFIYPPGNVRVTLDYDIRTGLSATDFLDPHCLTVPAGDAPIILEVKWDEYLPDLVRQATALENLRSNAFSKYAQCRIYG